MGANAVRPDPLKGAAGSTDDSDVTKTIGYRELLKAVAQDTALLVVGAGVSIAATERRDTASWPGLLTDGIERCVQLRHITEERGRELKALLAEGDVTDLLTVAYHVGARLQRPEGGEYRDWLVSAIGSLPAKDQRLIRAINSLGAPIITTNYDDLIERVTGREAITWLDSSQLATFAREYGGRILHLHGHFRHPRSIVFDPTEYDRVVGNEILAAVELSCRLSRAVVYLGFGAGLEDPHFRAARAWISRNLQEGSPAYLLLRENECVRLQATGELQRLTNEERIRAIPYGSHFDDLPKFLSSVAMGAALEKGSRPFLLARLANILDNPRQAHLIGDQLGCEYDYVQDCTEARSRADRLLTSLSAQGPESRQRLLSILTALKLDDPALRTALDIPPDDLDSVPAATLIVRLSSNGVEVQYSSALEPRSGKVAISHEVVSVELGGGLRLSVVPTQGGLKLVGTASMESSLFGRVVRLWRGKTCSDISLQQPRGDALGFDDTVTLFQAHVFAEEMVDD